MKLYEYGTDCNTDLLIVQWWMRMREDGDLKLVFFPALHSLSAFVGNWKSGDLMLEIDDKGITAAMWVNYFMSSAVIGLYIRPDKRHHLGTLRAVLGMYRMLFTARDGAIKSIIGVTKQPDLLPEHEKLGYKVLGKVAGIYNGEDGYVVVLAQSDFMARWSSINAVEIAAHLSVPLQ